MRIVRSPVTLDDKECDVVREVLEGMLIKHDAEQWMRTKQAAGAE